MNFLKEYRRMCNSHADVMAYKNCEIHSVVDEGDCWDWILKHYDQAVEIITKLAKKHPQRTRQDVFLEQHPKAMVDRDGLICIDPCNIEQGLKKMDCRDYFLNCTNCRRNYWLAPAEEEE